MSYRGYREDRVISKLELDARLAVMNEVAPLDEIRVRRQAKNVESFVKRRHPKAHMGEGFSLEVVAAIGRLLNELRGE